MNSGSATVGRAELRHDSVMVLAAFCRTLGAAGVAITTDRTQYFLAAIDHLDVLDVEQVYWAGRLTLCGDPEDLGTYDAAFLAYFSGAGVVNKPALPHPIQLRIAPVMPQSDDAAESAELESGADPLQAKAAEVEVLRHSDLGQLSADQRRELARMLELLRPGLPMRRSLRRHPGRSGSVDPRRTVRAMLQAGGEPARLARRERRTTERRIVLLIDVSGSMTPYADSLLRFAHVLTRRLGVDCEVFTIGTRLTRLTRAMAERDPNRALAACAATIPDWSGGTRLGEVLKAFTDRWGQRGTARGAVVVIFSDGWERGTPELLAEQVGRLQRLARTVVWVNPHKGKAGYQPVQGGIMAVLPAVDHFLAGHSLATLEELLEVVRHA